MNIFEYLCIYFPAMARGPRSKNNQATFVRTFILRP